MALSYNLGYQESISVHPTRRQIFAGKPYSIFPNIWEWLILRDTSKVNSCHYHHGQGRKDVRLIIIWFSKERNRLVIYISLLCTYRSHFFHQQASPSYLQIEPEMKAGRIFWSSLFWPQFALCTESYRFHIRNSPAQYIDTIPHICHGRHGR